MEGTGDPSRITITEPHPLATRRKSPVFRGSVPRDRDESRGNDRTPSTAMMMVIGTGQDGTGRGVEGKSCSAAEQLKSSTKRDGNKKSFVI